MNFIISSTTLLKHLQSISGVVAPKSNIPILTSFLFKVEKDKLIITGSDLETVISTTITDVNVKQEGTIAILGQKILETLKTFSDVPLTFTVDDDSKSINIVSESGTYKLVGQSPDEFPKTPEINEKGSFTIHSTALVSAINKTIFAVAEEEINPAMSAILIEVGADGIQFVGTNSHKLAVYKRKDASAAEIGSILIPNKPLNHIKSTLEGIEEDITIQFSDKNIRLEVANLCLVSRLMNMQFPNYQAVIPKNNPNKLTVDRLPFLNVLKRVAIFASKSNFLVQIQIAGSELNIFGQDLDFSYEASETLPCSYDGEDMTIAFNSKFLIEIINNLQSEQVVFELDTPTRAGLIIPSEFDAEVEDILMLIMPIAIKKQENTEEANYEANEV